MTEKNYYPAAAVIMLVVAVGQISVSKTFHTVWGIDANDTTIFMSHRWGWMTLALTWVLWNARNQPGMYPAFNLSVGLSSLAHGVYTALGVMNGMLSAFGWGPVALELGLGIGFLYLFVRGRS